MQTDVKAFIRGCKTCQQNQIDTVKKAGQMNIRRIFPDKQVAWSMDFMGYYTSTATNGNRYLMVMTEATTKYVILKAVRNKSAKTVVRELDAVFHDKGFPLYVKADNGTEFANTDVMRYLESHGVRYGFTSSYEEGQFTLGSCSTQYSVGSQLST